MVKQLLERVALGLESRAVPYMIIGGQAVLVYGEPRLTQGVDVTLGVGPEQLAKIQDLASASGWEVLADRPRTSFKGRWSSPASTRKAAFAWTLSFRSRITSRRRPWYDLPHPRTW